jgi:hypothetical protein
MRINSIDLAVEPSILKKLFPVPYGAVVTFPTIIHAGRNPLAYAVLISFQYVLVVLTGFYVVLAFFRTGN